LNNAVCALSAKPLKEEFGNFAYRRITSQCMTEALNVYQAKNITTVSPLALPLSWVPWALHLPDWIFSYLMAKMIGADDNATSSMYEDIKAGRKTEIDFLQGTIVKLAEGTNVDVSVSKIVYEKIKALETRNQGLLEHKPDEIYKFE
jgi:2-dehydropantoate 2-reductase